MAELSREFQDFKHDRSGRVTCWSGGQGMGTIRLFREDGQGWLETGAGKEVNKRQVDMGWFNGAIEAIRGKSDTEALEYLRYELLMGRVKSVKEKTGSKNRKEQKSKYQLRRNEASLQELNI